MIRTTVSNVPDDSKTEVREVCVFAKEAGTRLDRLLADRVDDLSRSRARALIDEGAVSANDRPAGAPNRKVRAGEVFQVRIPPPRSADLEPADIPLDVVHEDEHLLVIDKPIGLVVHPAPGHRGDTLVNALLAHCGENLSGIGGVKRPGIVHRLDRNTSGLIVVAKTDAAHVSLAAGISAKEVERSYFAVCWRVPAPPVGTVDAPIWRHPRDRRRMAVMASGKPAETHYRVMRSWGGEASVVACKLGTGRTHQIRVHFASIGCPVVGDSLYGRARNASQKLSEAARHGLSSFPRQALHAERLAFAHPATGEFLVFERPPPQDMQGLLHDLDKTGTVTENR